MLRRGQNGRRSSRGNRSHQTQRQPCRHYAANGYCRFGNNCRFSHGHSTQQGTGTPEFHDENKGKEARIHAWKRARPSLSASSGSDTYAWLKTGLGLVDEEAGLAQEVIRELATDGGLRTIVSIVEAVSSLGSEESRNNHWDCGLRFLFGIMSHSQVAESVALEQELAVIHRSILGLDGSRMKALYDLICKLAQTRIDTHDTGAESALQILSISAGVLSKVLDASISNLVNTCFEQIVKQIEIIIGEVPGVADTCYHGIQCRKYLQYIRLRLELGNALPEKVRPETAPSRGADFKLDQDLPGSLSQDGRRHDNDHEDIANIQLMPTVSEILSERDEYLPTTNPALHHKQGIQGLLDRQFRLLREDAFDGLRDVVRSELNIAAGIMPRKHAPEPRTKVVRYANPKPFELSFDKFNEVEVAVCFSQPGAQEKRSKQERREWWKASQRLTPGSLVCMVDEFQHAFFFTVSHKTAVSIADAKESRLVSRKKDGNNVLDDEDEENKLKSLSDDKHYAYVYLKIMESSDTQFKDTLLWWKARKHAKTQAMMEFPGIVVDSVLAPLKAL